MNEIDPESCPLAERNVISVEFLSDNVRIKYLVMFLFHSK
jgi:hypothetical protein